MVGGSHAEGDDQDKSEGWSPHQVADSGGCVALKASIAKRSSMFQTATSR